MVPDVESTETAPRENNISGTIGTGMEEGEKLDSGSSTGIPGDALLASPRRFLFRIRPRSRCRSLVALPLCPASRTGFILSSKARAASGTCHSPDAL